MSFLSATNNDVFGKKLTKKEIATLDAAHCESLNMMISDCENIKLDIERREKIQKRVNELAVYITKERADVLNDFLDSEYCDQR